MEENYTTISIKTQTKKRLELIGNKGLSWDELLNQLADFYQRYKPYLDAQKEINK